MADATVCYLQGEDLWGRADEHQVSVLDTAEEAMSGALHQSMGFNLSETLFVI